jgi:transposase
VERDIAKAALDDPNVTRLMTIPGIDMVVAVGLMAAIGKVELFDKPDKLAAYIGLNPSVHQSGDMPAHHQARPVECPPSARGGSLAERAQSWAAPRLL